MGLTKLFLQATTKATWINTFSEAFSRFVAKPLAIYETGLKSINIVATLGAISALNNAQNITMPNRLASSFLYDYVNLFKGNIKEMRYHIVNNYKYFNPPQNDVYGYIEGDIKIYSKTIPTKIKGNILII